MNVEYLTKLSILHVYWAVPSLFAEYFCCLSTLHLSVTEIHLKLKFFLVGFKECQMLSTAKILQKIERSAGRLYEYRHIPIQENTSYFSDCMFNKSASGSE